MPTFTARAVLQKDDPGENYDVTVVNGNLQKVDDFLGLIMCTSSTRPASPFDGMAIYERDTGLLGTWRSDLASWVLPRATLYASNARPTVGLYHGYAFYRTDRNWIEVWDGAAWRVRSNPAVCSSTADRDAGITHPYNGQIAITTDSYRFWVYRAGTWRPLSVNTPIAQFKQTAVQTLLASGAAAPLVFQGEDHDSHNVHTTSDVFVYPMDGTYEFTGGCAFAAHGTGARVLHWTKNNVDVDASDASAPSSGAGLATRMVARTIQITGVTGDGVRLLASQFSGLDLNTFASGIVRSSMSVKFLGQL